MPLHTVESLIPAAGPTTGRHFYGTIEIPDGTADPDAFCRQKFSLANLSNNLAINACEVQPGAYFPRMARPYHIQDSYIGHVGPGPLFSAAENMAIPLPHNVKALGNSVGQLAILVEAIRRVLEFIHPSSANFSAFGHQTRNILLLACMDFENECRGVLEAHNYSGSRLSTNDYVKSCQPLWLKEYEVELSHYPDLPTFAPFASWNSPFTTRTIVWYDSYNAVKHDREGNFSRSTLLDSISAVCAVAIMLAAQYRIIWNWQDQVCHFFRFVKYPIWNKWQYLTPPNSRNFADFTKLVYPF